MTTPADLAAARREARDPICRMLRHLCNVYGCTSYGRKADHGPESCSWCEAEALLAASPEPATAPPEEVREAAERAGFDPICPRCGRPLSDHHPDANNDPVCGDFPAAPAPEPVSNPAIRDLNMQCLCRASYGGYTRAALAMVRCGLRSAWLNVRFDLTMFWARKVRRMTEEEMERRYFS